jgi:hypothetical protein
MSDKFLKNKIWVIFFFGEFLDLKYLILTYSKDF